MGLAVRFEHGASYHPIAGLEVQRAEGVHAAAAQRLVNLGCRDAQALGP